MVKTLEELQKELDREKLIARRIRLERDVQLERRKVKFEIRRLRNPGFFRAGEAIIKGSKTLGRGIVAQAKLIKLQQIREQKERNAISKALKNKRVIKRVPIKRKKVVKRVVRKAPVKRKRKSKKRK